MKDLLESFIFVSLLTFVPKVLVGSTYVLLFAACVSHAHETGRDRADALYQKALEASAPEYSEGTIREGVRLLDEALRYDSDHEPSLDYRATLLMTLGRTSEALADLERLFALRGTAETGFSLCMAWEYVTEDSPQTRRCFRDIVRLYEARIDGPPHLDENYLMALKMADEAAFETALDQALREVGSEAEMWGPEGFNLEILRMDRHAILDELYSSGR